MRISRLRRGRGTGIAEFDALLGAATSDDAFDEDAGVWMWSDRSRRPAPNADLGDGHFLAAVASSD